MVRRFHSNIALDTTLVNGITGTDSSLVVASALGWPSAPFVLVIERDTASEELILVGNKSGTTFSALTRGFGGTSAVGHNAGVAILHVAVAEDFDEVYTHNHESGQGYTPISHDGLNNIQPDDHHPQSHASRHAAGQADPFLHAGAHAAGAGDQFLHAAAHLLGGGDPLGNHSPQHHGVLGVDKSWHLQVVRHRGPTNITYQTYWTSFWIATFPKPAEWTIYDLDILGLFSMLSNPGTKIAVNNHMKINGVHQNSWFFELSSPTSTGINPHHTYFLHEAATSLSSDTALEFMGDIYDTPPSQRVDLFSYVFLLLGRVRT